MVTPLTQKYFGFGELGNSVMYSLCGVEVIAGFFLVRWLSRVLEDRVVLAVGLLICSGACVWCLIFLANPQGVCVYVCVWQTSRETGIHLGMDRHNMPAQFGANSMICIISLELL